MKNFFTMLWVAFISLLIAFAIHMIGYIYPTYILALLVYIFFWLTVILILYSLIVGLLYPMLNDLYKSALKLDKKG